ncbi:MAG TPA: VanZ family protein, partial [Alphaproteobacteria bacterium]|nr:VanZ family protein [Alphaproteobacteria bacterium]
MSSSALHQTVPATPPRKLRAWIPTLLWLCVLAGFSTDVFSAEHTGGILVKIVHALFGQISAHQFLKIHFFVRKSAHFCSYGLLSALAFFSWRATLPSFRRWTFRWSLLAVLLAAAAGGLDEFHQRFVPSRGSSIHDVLLDSIGAVFFQLVIALWLSR